MKKIVLSIIFLNFLYAKYIVEVLSDSNLSINNEVSFKKVAGDTFEIEENDEICIKDKGNIIIKTETLNIPLTEGCENLSNKTKKEPSVIETLTSMFDTSQPDEKAGVSLYNSDENKTKEIKLELK